MSLKHLLGLEDVNITDEAILSKLKDAYDHDQDTVEFIREDQTKVVIRLPHVDASDEWLERVHRRTGEAS